MGKLLSLTGILAMMTGLLTSCSKVGTTADYRTIPAVREITTAPAGEFALTAGTKIIYPEGNVSMQRNASFLAGYLQKATGTEFRTEAGTDGKGNIMLQLVLPDENPEAYSIKVTPDGVTISGASEAGVFYGIQTLRKSIPVVAGSTPVLPAVEISDSPRFGYRGVHFDISRHFFNVDEAKQYIDMMTLHNMNRLHWHLTDDQGWRIEIKKYPLLTEIGSKRKETVIGHNSGEYDGKPYGGFYTQDQIREVVEYAAERYITVIPEIDLPGHMQAALAAYPHLGCTGGPYEVWTQWGVSEDVLCAGNDSVLTFIDDVLTEIMELFPSEYIHIGGDECPKIRWENCPKCQARIKELGIKSDEKHNKEEYLQSYIINHAEQFLNRHGRRIIGWDEILEGGLAPGATVMSWRGEGGGIEAARQKHDVIMTPNTYLYLDYYQTKDVENEPLAIGGYVPVERVYSYEPVPAVLTPDERKHILGVQANHWSEYIPAFSHLQYMALPRWAALSEIQWSDPAKKDYADFLSRLPQMIRLYDAEGYNYATHVFDVKADFTADTNTGAINVALKTIDNAPVHYTTDGTVPTAESPVADSIIAINKACTLNALAIRQKGQSRMLTEKISFSKSTAKPITANQPVNKQYEFKGVTTLTDGLKGNGNYRTGRWIAFYGNDMDVTIDLMHPAEISTVTFTACVEKGDWIFDARSVTVEVSEDGENFTEVASESAPAMKDTDRNGLYEHRYTFSPVKARYVRVTAESEKSIPDWHGGKGNYGFLFVDEIAID